MSEASGIYRSGELVVVTRGAHMPACCATCGEPIVEPIFTELLQWVPRGAGGVPRVGKYAGFLADAVDDTYGQSVLVRFAYCPEHRRRFHPRRVSRIVLAASLVGFPMMVALGVSVPRMPSWGVVCLCLIPLAAMFVGVHMRTVWPPFHIVHFENNCAWVAGFGEGFYHRLPDYELVRAKQITDAADALNQVSK